MTLRALSLAALAGGIVLAVWAVATGEAQAGLLLLFPFVAGTGPITLAAVALLFLGMVGLFHSFTTDRVPPPGPSPEPSGRGPAGEESDESRTGGVILLGPIPIVFGSDRRTATLAALGGLLLLAALVLLFLWVRT